MAIGRAVGWCMAIGAAVCAAACSDPPVPPVTGTIAEQLASCDGLDAGACQQPAPSFANEIQPLLDNDCNNSCHNPGNAQFLWPLSGYQDVRDWSNLILRDVAGCAMPPLDGGVLMPAVDRAKVISWVVCGAPNN